MLSKPGEARITPRANARKKAAAEESPDEVVRRLQRLPSNKACADCSSKLTQCVNLTHGTFVCMPCSGVHREFNHKIKGIGHSSFTPDEASMLKLPTSGNESVNARYLAKYDANAAASSASTTSGRYYDQSNRHNSNTRNVLASSTMKPPQNNSDLQHLRSWIQQKYIVKCWLAGEGGGGEEERGAKKGGAGGSGEASSRRKIMPTKVHRPASSLSALTKPTTTTTFTSGTSNSANASHDDSFFDAIASSPAVAANDASSWDAFGASSASGMSSSSPPAFQADFGDFSGQQQQQQPSSQFQTATMVSLPPLSTATGGSTESSQAFQAANFNQNITTAILHNNIMMMQGVGGEGSFVADFSSMPQPQQPQIQVQQQQPFPTMQVQHNQGFASFPPMQPQQPQPQQQSQLGPFLQQGLEQGQHVHPQSNYEHMQGGSGMTMMMQQQHLQTQQQHGGEIATNTPTHSGVGNLSGFPQQQSQPHDQSSFANFSSVQNPQQISNSSEESISNDAASMPQLNPNAFKVIDSDKMSAFDAFDDLALEPTLTTTYTGNASSAEGSNTSATVPMTGENGTRLYEGEQVANNGSGERSVFATNPTVRTNNESNPPYHPMSVNGASNAYPPLYPEGEMLVHNTVSATASENSINKGNSDDHVAVMYQETTFLIQKLNLQQLRQVHQLVSSMTSSSVVGNVNQRAHLPSMSAPHDVSSEHRSSNGAPRIGMEEMGETSIESMDAMNVPPTDAPEPPPPAMTVPSNALPPVEKEGNPFDF